MMIFETKLGVYKFTVDTFLGHSFLALHLRKRFLIFSYWSEVHYSSMWTSDLLNIPIAQRKRLPYDIAEAYERSKLSCHNKLNEGKSDNDE